MQPNPASPAQRAVAFGLDREQGFYTGLGGVLAGKRALLERQLAAIGFAVLPAQARRLPRVCVGRGCCKHASPPLSGLLLTLRQAEHI